MLADSFQFRELNFVQIFQIYIVQGFIFVFFLIMAYKILKRDRSRLNFSISGLYISTSIGFFINFIFPLIPIEIVMTIMYLLTMFFLYFAQIFLTTFVSVIKSSPKIFTLKKQLIILGSYALLLSGMFLIPGGLTINESTDWHPVYSDVFIVFLLVVLSLAVVPTFLNSIHIYKLMENEKLKQRWSFFIIGMIFLYLFGYGTIITYKITLGEITLIWNFISLALILLGSYFIYYGFSRPK